MQMKQLVYSTKIKFFSSFQLLQLWDQGAATEPCVVCPGFSVPFRRLGSWTVQRISLAYLVLVGTSFSLYEFYYHYAISVKKLFNKPKRSSLITVFSSKTFQY